MSAIVTHHARERGGLRLGLKPSSVARMAELALVNGIGQADCRGALRRYLDGLFLKERKATNSRIYGEHVFLFAGEILITILHLPNSYKAQVKKLKEARKAA